MKLLSSLFATGLLFASTLTQAAIINKCHNNGVFAITFDEGPSVNNTDKILKVLASKNVKASFHVITQFFNDPTVTGLVKRLANEGHLVGYRTEPTWDLSTMSDQQLEGNLTTAIKLVSDVAGKTVFFVRTPFNGTSDHQISVINAAGFIVTQHNLDSYDYDLSVNIANKYKAVLDSASSDKNSFISVHRDFTSLPIDELGPAIDLVLSKGYRFVLLDECVSGGKPAITTSPTPGPPTPTLSSSSTETVTTAGVNGSNNAQSGALSSNQNFSYALTLFLIVFTIVAYRFQATPQ